MMDLSIPYYEDNTKTICMQPNYKIMCYYRHLKRDLSNVNRKIIQYDLDMNEIKRWDSIVSIVSSLNLQATNIIKCCKGERIHCGGFKWRYYD